MSGGGRRGVRRFVLIAIPVVLFLVVFVVARLVGGGSSAAQDDNPFTTRLPLAGVGTAGAGAVSSASGDDRRLLERLAAVPQAIWLTPEGHSIDEVGTFVAAVSAQGAGVGRPPVFVVYGITDRDCSGGHSSGGLPPEEYSRWVGRIAESMASGARAVAIVEPDALATAEECGQVDRRTGQLRDAVGVLARAGATVYLDAGHSGWIDPQKMASLLTAAGVDSARGFSTNVAGYESTRDETTYAEAIAAQLGGAHYVIDTGRNGAGSNGEWCNPSGRALGQEPRAGDGGALDAQLWIKPPGESDGACGGGPAAGVFWTQRALELARAAGW